MAIGNKTICIILWSALGAGAAEFPVMYRGHAGRMTVDETAVRFGGLKWKLDDIRELKVAPGSVTVMSYRRGYEFTGEIPAAEVYRVAEPLMARRVVLEGGSMDAVAHVLWSAAVKHEAPRSASEGTLAFGEDSVVYETTVKGEARTWRYEDIDNIASSGPFQLTVTTYERSRWQYAGRKDFNFVLKQPIDEASYNRLWLQMERKNGKLR